MTRWLPVILMVVVIYTTIPVVRRLREWFAALADPGLITWLVAAVIVAAAGAGWLLGRRGSFHRRPGSTLSIANSPFADNGAAAGDPEGAAIHLTDGVPADISSTIVATTSGGSSIVCTGEAAATLTCCNLFGNDGGDWTGCVVDQLGVTGNVSEDPLFCGDASSEGFYTLHSNSPCAPDWSPDGCGLIGAWGVGCSSTPVRVRSWGAIKALFR